MKRFSQLVTVVIAAGVAMSLAGLVLASTTSTRTTTHSAMKKMEAPIAWAAEDLKWTEVPNTNGAMSAELWGHMDKGAYGTLIKFPVGWSEPMHTHTGAIRAVVISGTMVYTPEGESPHKLGSGSYLMIPGNSKHSTACEGDSPCTIFMEQSAKFDLIPVGSAEKK